MNSEFCSSILVRDGCRKKSIIILKAEIIHLVLARPCWSSRLERKLRIVGGFLWRGCRPPGPALLTRPVHGCGKCFLGKVSFHAAPAVTVCKPAKSAIAAAAAGIVVEVTGAIRTEGRLRLSIILLYSRCKVQFLGWEKCGLVCTSCHD